MKPVPEITPPLRLKFKPEVQAKIDARAKTYNSRFVLRARTPEEREQYDREREAAERERIRGWPICICCQKPREKDYFQREDVMVCDTCTYRGMGYGRIQGRFKVRKWMDRPWELNVAMALIRELEWECRRQKRISRETPMTFPKGLTSLLLPSP